MNSITMYGCASKPPAAMKRGTCGPLSSGMTICSTSKPTMAVGSSWIDGTFITAASVRSGRATRHKDAMPPRCTNCVSSKPSICWPTCGGPQPVHQAPPVSSSLARWGANPASRTLRAAASWSYGTRQNVSR